MSRMRCGLAILAVLAMARIAAVRAEEIAVSNYGISAAGIPYAVALAKGFFQQEGADVTGIIAAAGGDTTVHALLDGKLSFAEADLPGVIAAIRAGADLRIVSDNVLTAGDFVWATRPNSSIRSLQELRGRRIGYTTEHSTSQTLNMLLLKQSRLLPADVTLVPLGGFAEQLAALNQGTIDVATLADPVWSKNSANLRTLARASEMLPPLCSAVGVVTGQALAVKGDFIRAVLRARRRAVAFLYTHQVEASRIVAKVYDIEPAIARETIRTLTGDDRMDRPFWGVGQFDLAGMNRMLATQKLAAVDWSKIIDRQFLPEDQQADY